MRATRPDPASASTSASSSSPSSSSCRITVVIPALNEAERIGRAVASARAHADADVVVVDGGSADGTKGAARRAGARVLTSLRGRGRQMNVGAAAAGARDDGDSLLVFLHADSSLPSGYGETIEREMCGGRSRRDWGAFAFKMTEAADGDSWAGGMIRRAIEFGTNCRCKLFGTPYGDQGLVIRRRAFDDVGGFEELPFMEDYVMVQKLRRRSAPRLFQDPVVTSGRRWDERGLAKVTLLNQVILMGYHLGVPVERLAKWYQFNF